MLLKKPLRLYNWYLKLTVFINRSCSKKPNAGEVGELRSESRKDSLKRIGWSFSVKKTAANVGFLYIYKTSKYFFSRTKQLFNIFYEIFSHTLAGL